MGKTCMGQPSFRSEAALLPTSLRISDLETFRSSSVWTTAQNPSTGRGPPSNPSSDDRMVRSIPATSIRCARSSGVNFSDLPSTNTQIECSMKAPSLGNHADITEAPALLAKCPAPTRLLADKGYNANSLGDRLAEAVTEAIIPSTRSRRTPIPHDANAYRDRNLIERAFCRLKD